MDPLLLTAAFILGFAVRQVGLPPMVGFLIAGFSLHAFGIQGGAALERVADIGVILLLFSIGLKLKLKSFFRSEIYGTACIHILVSTLVFNLALYAASFCSISIFSALDFPDRLILAFALSFSSTVFAVKILEEKSEMASLHGRIAIGILIMQDLFAVLFMTLFSGKTPSAWALVLLAALPFIRYALSRMLDRCGHGELVILFALAATMLVGAELFDMVGLKPDLGALIMGVLLSTHPKANEVSNALLSFKDLFLVGFFVNIGLAGAPDMTTIAIACGLLLLIPLKTLLYVYPLQRFGLRGRTSLVTAFSLANYSEFGLIVAALGVKLGWFGQEWLTILAIAVSLSFIIASPVNKLAADLSIRWEAWFKRFEPQVFHPEETLLPPAASEIVIFGMGRVGSGAYDHFQQTGEASVMGLDFNPDVVARNNSSGRHTALGDAGDPQTWACVTKSDSVRLVLLTMAHKTNMCLLQNLREQGYKGHIAATAEYDDQVRAILEAGADMAYNLFGSAGEGLATHAQELLPDHGE